MNNREVVRAFLDRRKGQSGSMRSTGDELYSYNTVILQRYGEYLIGNITKYSVTTSRHQGIAGVLGADVRIAGIPAGAIDLVHHMDRQIAHGAGFGK